MSINHEEADRVWASGDIVTVTRTVNQIVAKYLAQGAAAWQAQMNKGLGPLIREQRRQAFQEAVLAMQGYMVDPTTREFPTNPYEVNEFDIDVDAIEKEINK